MHCRVMRVPRKRSPIHMFFSTLSVAASNNRTRIAVVGLGSAANHVIAALSRLPSVEDSCATVTRVVVTDDAREAGAVYVSHAVSDTEVAKVVREHLGGKPDLAVVVADLGDSPLGVTAAPAMCQALLDAGCLTLSVALLPRPCGNVRLSRSTDGLARLRKSSSSTLLIDTATLTTSMSGASVLDAHNLFSEMVAFNLHSLLLPLVRANDFRKISLDQFREVFSRNALDTRGRIARLVCAQATSEHRGERGKVALKTALTDHVFPLNDLSTCQSIILSIDSSKDLTYSELEQAMQVSTYIAPDATIIDGLSFSGDVIEGGVKVTLCAIEGDEHGLTAAEMREDDLERERITKAKEISSNVSSISKLWERLKQWW